jgi:uncharacterized coiled-coil DUF342 family protein
MTIGEHARREIDEIIEKLDEEWRGRCDRYEQEIMNLLEENESLKEKIRQLQDRVRSTLQEKGVSKI